MKTVIFACVHGAGRSQMAEAIFNRLADPWVARAVAAGSAPVPKVHAEVVRIMSEMGVDLKHVKPRLLTEALAADADLLVTMGCGESCPVVDGLRREDWVFDDPKGLPLAKVRQIREEIKAKVVELLKREGWGTRAGA